MKTAQQKISLLLIITLLGLFPVFPSAKVGVGDAVAEPALQTQTAQGADMPGDAVIADSHLAVSYLTLAPGSNEQRLNFSWHTKAKAEERKPLVRIWKQGGEAMEFAGESSENPLRISGMYYHRVTVTGLEADTSYAYQLGNGNGEWSLVYTTKTGNPSSFSFLVCGDPQVIDSVSGAAWAATVTAALARFPDVSFMMGTGDQVENPEKKCFDAFFMPEELSALPFATCVGNHEYAPGSYHAAHYMFNPPNWQTKPAADYWYRYGDALFMVTNCSTGMNTRAVRAHGAFIEQAIAQNPDAKWRILTFHYDVYGQGQSHSRRSGKDYRNLYVPIIDQYGIDAVFNGHDHSYSRSKQMMFSGNPNNSGSVGMQETVFDADGMALNPTGTVYFTLNSASGRKPYGLAPLKEYTAFMNQNRQKNITVVHMTADTFRCVTYEVSVDGELTEIDSYGIRKTR